MSEPMENPHSVFVIEKGVPMPDDARFKGVSGGLAAALRAMGVGDSILCPGRTQANVSSQARMTARLLNDGRTYASRKTPDGVRVWRVT